MTQSVNCIPFNALVQEGKRSGYCHIDWCFSLMYNFSSDLFLQNVYSYWCWAIVVLELHVTGRSYIVQTLDNTQYKMIKVNRKRFKWFFFHLNFLNTKKVLNKCLYYKSFWPLATTTWSFIFNYNLSFLCFVSSGVHRFSKCCCLWQSWLFYIMYTYNRHFLFCIRSLQIDFYLARPLCFIAWDTW